MTTCYVITHTEVEMDPNIPAPDWQLSATGLRRAQLIADLPWVTDLQRVVSSSERKAQETAAVLSTRLGLTVQTDPQLSENDRSSTGYLAKTEFELLSDAFFARPERSVRGWECALDAQQRIVDAVRRHSADQAVSTAYVTHGVVGSLLLSDLLGKPISRMFDQAGQGNYYAFDPEAWTASHRWRPL